MRARTRLSSRSGRDVTASFPKVEEALARQSADDFLLDGEAVASDGDRTSFARLQPRIRVSDATGPAAPGCRSSTTSSTCCAPRART